MILASYQIIILPQCISGHTFFLHLKITKGIHFLNLHCIRTTFLGGKTCPDLTGGKHK